MVKKQPKQSSKIPKPVPGDYVEIELGKRIYEGTLLETSETEKGIVLLKLDSGYNIGLKKKDTLNIKVIEKAKNQKKELEIKQDKDKPKIGMIITGGTIAAKLNPKKGGVDWLTDSKSLFKYYPELFEKVNVFKLEVPFMKASEDMDFQDWKKIARFAKDMLNDNSIQGIIVTHGTDFLHYTAAALSFFLRDLNKPVILTYSQRSIDRASSDANLNLRCSAIAAISDIAEVMLVGHSSSNDDFCYAMPGTKVKKMHSSKRDAFKTINSQPIAKIYPNTLKLNSNYNIKENKKVKTDLNFEEKVALLKIYPGQDPEILDFYSEQGYRGIVLEMSGLGHAPTKRARKSWITKLKEIQKKGVIVCGTTQCMGGRTDPLVYSNGRELVDTGIIYLGDMLSETAFVKLSWVLGHEVWVKQGKEKIKEKMLENISGEFNFRLNL
jgi:glutamyl-tRNA(Gln) amidotransferase subunit D